MFQVGNEHRDNADQHPAEQETSNHGRASSMTGKAEQVAAVMDEFVDVHGSRGFHALLGVIAGRARSEQISSTLPLELGAVEPVEQSGDTPHRLMWKSHTGR